MAQSVEAPETLKGIYSLRRNSSLAGMTQIPSHVSVGRLVQFFSRSPHFLGPVRRPVDRFPRWRRTSWPPDLQAAPRCWMRGHRPRGHATTLVIFGERTAALRVRKRYQVSCERTRRAHERTPCHRGSTVFQSHELNIDPMCGVQQTGPWAAVVKGRTRGLLHKLKPLLDTFGEWCQAQHSAPWAVVRAESSGLPPIFRGAPRKDRRVPIRLSCTLFGPGC